MRDRIIHNLAARFSAYGDLIEQIDDAALQVRLDINKHKSLAEHLWCIVGARESYGKALRSGQWDGFSCSMQQFTRTHFRAALQASADEVMAAINSVSEWTQQREEFLAALAEHEVMHEGQIIRHVYGTGAALPSSWKWA